MTEKCRLQFSFLLSSQCHLSSADSFCTFSCPNCCLLSLQTFSPHWRFPFLCSAVWAAPPHPLTSSSSPQLLSHVSWSSPPPPPRWSTRMGATRVHQKSLPPPLLGAAASSACWKMSGQGCPAQPHQLWLSVSILGPQSLVQHNLSRFSQRLQISALFSSTFLLNFNFWSKARSCRRVLVLWWHLF